MPTIPEGEADGLIRPQAERINRIIRSAWGALARYQPDLAIFTPRTRANIVRDHMVNNAIDAFDGVPGVSPRFRKGRFFLVFEDRLLVQLKKLSGRRRPRNYPTRQALDIENQQAGLFDDPRQLTLFDMSQIASPTIATAGYKLDKLQTQIEGVSVVCHDGQQMLWRLDIPDTLEATPTVARIPTPPMPPSRIIPKAPQTDQQTRETDGESS